MSDFIGLDVSQKLTAICVVNQDGKVTWQGVVASNPAEIFDAISKRGLVNAKVGMETGPLSVWLYHSLRGLGLTIDCIHARHVHAALSVQLNKTDKNDAKGIAQLVRSGWYQPIHVKSMDSHQHRLVLTAREKLVQLKTAVNNQIRGMLKTFGVVMGAGRNGVFAQGVETADPQISAVKPIVLMLLDTWRHLAAQIRAMDKLLASQAKNDAVCKLLMSVPGVGVLTAVSFKTAVDDPTRFGHVSDVGPYLGLTPKKYQSGEVDRNSGISKHGNRQTRSLLYEAALSIFKRYGKDTKMAAWAAKLECRAGHKKAVVALARKLATLLLSLWRNGEIFKAS